MHATILKPFSISKSLTRQNRWFNLRFTNRELPTFISSLRFTSGELPHMGRLASTCVSDDYLEIYLKKQNKMSKLSTCDLSFNPY